MIATPPQMPENAPAGSSGAMIIMPIITGSGSLLMSITMGHRPLMMVAGVMIMAASVIVGIIMFVAQHNGPRKRIREQRERYVDYLDQLREIVREVAATQRADSAFRHPAPDLLTEPARARTRRWERRASDPDFLDVRVGSGVRPLARRLVLKVDTSSPLIVYDPVCQGSADQLIELYADVPEMPLVVPLSRHSVISVVGDRDAGRGLVRAMIAQLAVFHSPHDVRIGVVRDHKVRTRWEWLKWLPHNGFEDAKDGPMPARFVSGNTVQVAELLADEIERRTVDLQRRRGKPPGPGTQRLVVVLDGEHQSTLSGLHAEPPVPDLASLGIHVITLVADRREEPESVSLRLMVQADGTLSEDTENPGAREDASHSPLSGTADRASVAHLTMLARLLAPYGISVTDGDDAMHETVGLPEILGVPDVAELDTRRTWRRRSTGDYLRVPIGVGPSGNTVLLDLKESAFGGMGPHGLVVGATGSGKSEMLRTMVASLVINHSPEHLALLLVDFKGGATFADTDRLPHSAGLITNLADDDSLVVRFREATFGELVRRQQLLKEAGNLPNLHAYEAARENDPTLDPLPHLLIIIDEFSELLTAHPDFAELFVAIGRIGRSIGVHLLLATQRLESGKIKGLESHLSYRVGLRTFSEAESREAIGVGDAYHLPPEPGSGYLKVDTSVFERFKAAMVSQPYVPPVKEEKEEHEPVLPLLSFNGLAKVTGADSLVESLMGEIKDKAEEKRKTEKRTTLQVTVDRLVASGADPVRPVWLPPLPEALTFDSVLTDLGEGGEALEGPGTEPHPAEAKAVFGLTDIPREQRVVPAEMDFTGGEGNVVILGGPQSGKSTLLRTMITSLAWRYPPGRVAVYAIDFGGGALQAMDELPHVAGVAGRADPERVQRILTDVAGHLDRRQRVFRKHKLDSPAALRQARADGRVPSSVVGDLFLMIDGWSAVRDAFDAADDFLMDIATRGPSLGVHTILTGAASSQVRSRLQALFGGRFELRLSDPMDSGIGRKIAEEIPKDTPGRGLSSSENHTHVALPRVDGVADDEDLTNGIHDLIARVKERWPQEAVQGVRTLPLKVELDDLLKGRKGTKGRSRELVLGMGESSLAPVTTNLSRDPHLVVFGDPQSGKSTLLRGLVKQIVQRPAKELGIVMVDFRRSHLELVPEDHLLAYCTTAEQTKAVADNLAGSLKQRLPGPDVTPKQLRERSWWQGLDLYIVVDDMDMIASRSNPLAPLAPFIPQGADLGLHVIAARRTGGTARAMFEPVLQSLSDMATPGMLFSGDRMEGRLANGTASKPLPQGRAQLALRGKRPDLVQVGWSQPPA
ncbi:type VII secretion protein EccCa [Nocardiopsis aegyptia]|uniref:S-DNA-T family DNA segregation ATPase FtsK/SpoIIIE n=1 Tax=Nocardiopsis aegyptia TaxID=220378 RepID=A0A7Z0JBK7_9ACTN|nr:type VII secretion protein EccCa [Nocardiopsis aegyptia]NYJ35565.1 S-DNA-T family DNA segregation ATPase FtsK/SpoIIIE [Nocardiopsis aegyptia]